MYYVPHNNKLLNYFWVLNQFFYFKHHLNTLDTFKPFRQFDIKHCMELGLTGMTVARLFILQNNIDTWLVKED